MSLATSELWQVTSYLAGERKGLEMQGLSSSQAWGARSGLLQ